MCSLVCQSVYLFACLSVCLFVRLFVCLSMCLYICRCQILSVEEAERIRISSLSEVKGLDEDSLSRLEEDVKDLGTLLKIASPLVSVCER